MQKQTRILTIFPAPVQASLLSLSTVWLGTALCTGNFWNAVWPAALIGVVIIIHPLAGPPARYAYCPAEARH